MPSKRKNGLSAAMRQYQKVYPTVDNDENSKIPTAPDYPDQSTESGPIEEELLDLEWTTRDLLIKQLNHFSALCYGIQKDSELDSAILAKRLISSLNKLPSRSSCSEKVSSNENSEQENRKFASMPILDLDKQTRLHLVMQLAKNQGLLLNSFDLPDDIKKCFVEENQQLILKLSSLKVGYFEKVPIDSKDLDEQKKSAMIREISIIQKAESPTKFVLQIPKISSLLNDPDSISEAKLRFTLQDSINLRSFLWVRILEDYKSLIVFSLTIKSNVETKWSARVRTSWGSASNQTVLKEFVLNNGNNTKFWKASFSKLDLDASIKPDEDNYFITIEFLKPNYFFLSNLFLKKK